MKKILTQAFFTFAVSTQFIFGQVDTLILNKTVTIENVTREYHLFLPDTTTNAPVVILFHGHSGTHSKLLGLNQNGINDPSIVAPYRKWLNIAQANNIILIIPNGFNIGDTLKGWNDCRADAQGNSEQNDVLFISTLIDHVVNTYQANSNRIYVNGTSNGGHFCIRLAEEIPQKITAFVAIVSANAVNTECVTGTIPVSAMFMNGTSDPLCPYNGGQMAGNRGEVFSTANTISYWVQRNGTNTTPVTTSIPNTFQNDSCTVTKHEFKNGINNTCVVLYRVNDGGHTDPSPAERYAFPAVPFIFGKQNGDIEMATEAWNFFKDKSNLTTNITDLTMIKDLSIYPNPASQSFSIDFGNLDGKDFTITIHNSIGQ